MIVGKFQQPYRAKQALKFHSQGGRYHWIEHKPEEPEPWWVMNAVPYRRGEELVGK